MTITEIISKIKRIDEDLVIYAKRIDGQFTSTSEAVLLQLANEELNMLTYEVAQKRCPGFEYFSEVFIIKEMIEDLEKSNALIDLKQKTEIVIHYAQFDA